MEDDSKVTSREAIRAVIIRKNKILLLHTNKGDYKFPGGGVEGQESHSECLIREVAEETGYINFIIKDKLGSVIERKFDEYDSTALFQMTSQLNREVRRNYMNETIEKAKELEELSRFLSEINQQKESHIGYCGGKEEEIYETLKEDFVSDDGVIKFFIARSNTREIVAAIGLDVDESSAEVWGPFNQTSSVQLQHQLWEQLVNGNPTVQTFHFFINKENIEQQAFMNELKAEKTGEHLILDIEEQDFNRVSEIKSTFFIQSDFQAFEQLHNETFPSTYYDAKTITERLSDKNMLRVLKTESTELQGYAYFEVDIEMAEASVEYIGIAKKAQNQGLGTILLKEVLTEMFSYPQISEIKLCVDNANSQANHVYIKAGFKPKDILVSYVLKL
ncbi:GNAT family N-acetyltransferase [Sporosarcina sp. FSL K6-3457]|uniref:GNAT family N-acetyltransferase n=1 Tax=Sporosarcina sp. FSL K6-3457 TaxID=2978204 RepID=UPI0030FAA0A7